MTQLADDIHGVVVVVDHTRKNRPDGQSLSSAEVFGPVQKWSARAHRPRLGRRIAGRGAPTVRRTTPCAKPLPDTGIVKLPRPGWR